MRNAAIIVLCLLSINGMAQPYAHATFSIAAICKDGILIEADSRSECFVRKDTVGYYDTLQKIFIVNNYAVANPGFASMGSDFFYHYLKEFEKTDTGSKVKEFLNSFLVFIKSRYPVYFDDFVNNPMIVAGYDKGTPYILGTKKGKFSVAKASGYRHTDSLVSFADDFFSALTCKEAADIIEECIKDSVSKYHLEPLIGGPIMALMITKDSKPVWIKNAPTGSPWETTREFLDEYKKGELNFHFFSREMKLEFENKVR